MITDSQSCSAVSLLVVVYRRTDCMFCYHCVGSFREIKALCLPLFFNAQSEYVQINDRDSAIVQMFVRFVSGSFRSI